MINNCVNVKETSTHEYVYDTNKYMCRVSTYL